MTNIITNSQVVTNIMVPISEYIDMVSVSEVIFISVFTVTITYIFGFGIGYYYGLLKGKNDGNK